MEERKMRWKRQKHVLLQSSKTASLLGLCVVMLMLNACVNIPGISFNNPSPPVKHIFTPTPQPLETTLPIGPYDAQVTPGMLYGPLPSENLDLCQPKGASGTRPAVLLIHGGAWVGGDKQDFENTCMLLAQQGFVAATINYRLAQNGDPTTQWPAQLVDSQLAVRWLRAQAAPLGIDPQHICAWGSSAGGQLAVYLGAQKTIHPGDEAIQYANEPVNISCVIDEFGPVDVTANKDQPLTNELTLLLGGATFQQRPDLYHDLSPVFSINAQSAPMLIVQGDQDSTVPPDESAELQQVLIHNHVPVRTITYHGEHGFYGLSKIQSNAILAQEINYIMLQEPTTYYLSR
jgi:acetyl esterase/lipase